MNEEQKQSCLKNGKLTGLMILLGFITSWLTFIALTTCYIALPNMVEHQYLRETTKLLIYISGGISSAIVLSALSHRGWNFFKEIISSWKGK